MQNRVTLANNFSHLHDQNLRAGSNAVSSQEEIAQFRLQNADLLKRQAELSQIINQQQAQKPLPEPPPLILPANATPQLQAYLTKRDQLIRGQIQVMNDYRTADPKTREDAVQKWRQQNAGLMEQVRLEAQALDNVSKK